MTSNVTLSIQYYIGLLLLFSTLLIEIKCGGGGGGERMELTGNINSMVMITQETLTSQIDYTTDYAPLGPQSTVNRSVEDDY